MTMKCSEADMLLHAYVDGELAGDDRTSYEAHLLACDACARASRLQARFKAALRGHLPRPELPAGLRERISLSLAAEPTRRRWPWQAYPRAFTISMAAAAAVLLLVASPARTRHSGVMEQALSTFHRDMPLDVLTDSCSAISDWFRGKLDFTVPAARSSGCRGARLVNVSDRFGAYVMYQGPAGHRLGLMVFPSDDDTIVGQHRRVLGGRDVYVGTSRGVATAAFRAPDGLAYVFTADLDEDSLATWVEHAFLHQPQ